MIASTRLFNAPSQEQLHASFLTLLLPRVETHARIRFRDVQCPAGVRYGEVAVSIEEACTAHLISLEVCEVSAQSIGRSPGGLFDELRSCRSHTRRGSRAIYPSAEFGPLLERS